jgi:hypothetical protein
MIMIPLTTELVQALKEQLRRASEMRRQVRLRAARAVFVFDLCLTIILILVLVLALFVLSLLFNIHINHTNSYQASTGSQVPSLVAAESSSALAELAAEKEELMGQNSRQEQIIMFLRDQLARATVQKESESARPAPHDLRHLDVENSKLRELCQLLQDKLARATAGPASSSRASSSHGRPHVA